jgi:hypothetical protein
MYSQFGFVPLFFIILLCIKEGILNYTNAIRSHVMMIAHINFISSIFFWQESENKIICMIDRRVREKDMNAFRCLYESEK